MSQGAIRADARECNGGRAGGQIRATEVRREIAMVVGAMEYSQNRSLSGFLLGRVVGVSVSVVRS